MLITRTPGSYPAGTYKVQGVGCTVNAFGCLLGCDDNEATYEAQPGVRGKEHYGTHAKYFAVGFGGKRFATAAFWDYVETWY